MVPIAIEGLNCPYLVKKGQIIYIEETNNPLSKIAFSHYVVKYCWERTV